MAGERTPMLAGRMVETLGRHLIDAKALLNGVGGTSESSSTPASAMEGSMVVRVENGSDEP